MYINSSLSTALRLKLFYDFKCMKFPQMIGTNEGAKHFVRRMMCTGRLKQFALAKRLLFDSE